MTISYLNMNGQNEKLKFIENVSKEFSNEK